MKRIPRDPIRFDLLNAFAAHGKQQRVSLRHPETMDSFVAATRSSLKDSLTNDAFVYGQRTQAMFEALVASLGSVQLLKQEDAGEIYTAVEPLEVPDFRVILADGAQTLIEVKNFHQGGQPTTAYRMDKPYLDGLLKYAGLVRCDLRVAVYWVVWNLWTLTPYTVLQVQDDKAVLDLSDAMQFNEMSLLGDMLIGTRFPLRLRFVADKTKPSSMDKEQIVSFTIGQVELYCGDAHITREEERLIATHLMLYGKWREENKVLFENGQVEGVEFRWSPEEDHNQGFEIVGSLSEMFSSFYRQATLENGQVGQIHIDVTPGSLGQLVPRDYQGTALPLWRFIPKPPDREQPRPT